MSRTGPSTPPCPPALPLARTEARTHAHTHMNSLKYSRRMPPTLFSPSSLSSSPSSSSFAPWTFVRQTPNQHGARTSNTESACLPDLFLLFTRETWVCLWVVCECLSNQVQRTDCIRHSTTCKTDCIRHSTPCRPHETPGHHLFVVRLSRAALVGLVGIVGIALV